ncbi:MAG: cupin domain-containing protein [Betaproteobacteria bacterium]|jgi:mannose-6-phosphate isomerase-like protein (cupin superfamily)|nr:cupin domain-containing protein [Betaproteobacteria bacterium]
MTDQKYPTRVAIEQADAQPMPANRLSKQVLKTPGLEARWYRPPNPDPQVPHDRDEVYVVVSGNGDFVRGEDRVKFSSGDMLFAAKGEAHRFENHTPDTSVWVIFGPGA